MQRTKSSDAVPNPTSTAASEDARRSALDSSSTSRTELSPIDPPSGTSSELQSPTDLDPKDSSPIGSGGIVRRSSLKKKGTSPKRRSERASSRPSGLEVAFSEDVDEHDAPPDWMAPQRDEIESSADENTAIIGRERADGLREYGAGVAQQESSTQNGEQIARDRSNSNNRKSLRQRKKGRTPPQDDHGNEIDDESWWKKLSDRFGSVELDNKGSVARDHLALERTFLAWLRTSLSFASIGIAITQLFRLNTSITSPKPDPHDASRANLRRVGKPLGATFVGISIVILFIGFHRYFESQHYVIRGKFPAGRGSIALVAGIAGALIVASLVVIVAVAPSTFET